MCDYSLESFRSEKAVVGEKYVLNASYTHGFMKPLPPEKALRDIRVVDLCMACVQPGQKLQLTNIKWTTRQNLPTSMVVTVVRRKALGEHRHFGSYRDGFELPEGLVYQYGDVSSRSSVPLVVLSYADMEVIPERDLSQVFDLSGAEAPAEKARELVDND